MADCDRMILHGDDGVAIGCHGRRFASSGGGGGGGGYCATTRWIDRLVFFISFFISCNVALVASIESCLLAFRWNGAAVLLSGMNDRDVVPSYRDRIRSSSPDETKTREINRFVPQPLKISR